MIPIEHKGCDQFDQYVAAGHFQKTDQGFYITYIEWDQVPAESVEELKRQIEALRVQNNIPPEQEMKPFAVIGTCPFCEAPLVENPAGSQN